MLQLCMEKELRFEKHKYGCKFSFEELSLTCGVFLFHVIIKKKIKITRENEFNFKNIYFLCASLYFRVHMLT
jgi:hypothetical protein